jgi:hypothetical protein
MRSVKTCAGLEPLQFVVLTRSEEQRRLWSPDPMGCSCWPEALSQIRISELAFLIYLGNPLLSSDLGYSVQMGHPDGYVDDSRSI